MKTIYMFVILMLFSETNFCATSLRIYSNNSDSSAYKSFSISNSNIEKFLGRKLTWKEKVGLFFYKKKIVDKYGNNADLKLRTNRKAVWGFSLMLVGIILFPLEIPAFILSQRALEIDESNPGILSKRNKRLAKIGKIASLILMIWTVISIIIVLIALSNLSFNFNFSNWQFY